MTVDQILARCEAYEECAMHLEQRWTEDKEEMRQGEILASNFRKNIERLMRAHINKSNP